MALIDYSESDFQAWCAERERHLEEIRLLKELLVVATTKDRESNVVYLSQQTYEDIPPDRILSAAQGELETVVLMGYTHDGDHYFASSTGDKKTILWLAENMASGLLRADHE